MGPFSLYMPKYCRLLEKKHDCSIFEDNYLCRLTGKACVAANFEDGDPGNPASYEYWRYNNLSATKCPGYDLSGGLVEQIRKIIKEGTDSLKKI